VDIASYSFDWIARGAGKLQNHGHITCNAWDESLTLALMLGAYQLA
jgi:hypothetical protein